MFVPEGEESEYKRVTSVKVVGVPANVRGITSTRNWILDNTEYRYVVMIDDDLKRAGWVHLKPFKTKSRKLTEEDILGEWAKLFAVTEDLGLRIWGVATQGSPRAVYPWRPFLFNSYVTASCMGIVNDGSLRFDESFPVKEDYELCLRCIEEDGGVVAARYFYWENEHWSTPGGCADYRTQQMEARAIRRLMEMYPGHIRQVKRKGTGYAIELHVS